LCVLITCGRFHKECRAGMLRKIASSHCDRISVAAVPTQWRAAPT
jgi:hypothetical protein